MNITDLLAGLQAQHDETTVRAGEPRGQIEHLTATLAETEAPVADLATTAKVIAELAPAQDAPEPPETSTAYQAIVNACNQHPDLQLPTACRCCSHCREGSGCARGCGARAWSRATRGLIRLAFVAVSTAYVLFCPVRDRRRRRSLSRGGRVSGGPANVAGRESCEKY